MLYVIYGKDTAKARSKLTELLDTLQKKRPDASLFRMTPENWKQTVLDELLSSKGLFSSKYILVIDNLLNFSESADTISSSIREMSESEHVCIMIEEKILAADLKKLEKYAVKIQECAPVEKAKKESPAVFAFAEAVSMKESKRAWALFQDILNKETAAEEIHGVLWWQFKSLKLARDAGSAGESGLSPYVYQKSVRAAKVWSGLELEKVIDRLADMYHQAHRGEIDFMMELEKFSLSPFH